MLFVLLVFFGCAPSASQQQVDMFWPPPPAQPRIKYLESWHKADDFGKSAFAAFAENIVGEETTLMMRKPQAVAVDSSGRIYVTDTIHGAVIVVDKVAKNFWLLGREGQGKLSVPVDIAIDEGNGRIYVSDSKSKVVNIYDMNGFFLMNITGDGGPEGAFERPTGLAIDKKLRRLYVADTLKHKFLVFSLDGKYISTTGIRGGEDGQFNYPIYIAINSKSEVYIVDSGNFRVQAFDSEGKFILKFGRIGDCSLDCFARPKGIAIDSEDHVYVSDTAFNNFRLFNPDGQMLMDVGHAGPGLGEFRNPAGISIDQHDRIYVVDQLNLRVQVFQYLGGRYSGEKKNLLDK